MCEPASLAMGMQGFGAVTSAFGARSSAQATKNADNYQAAVDANNVQYDAMQASMAIVQGQQQTNAERLKYGALKGTQEARLAANGVDIHEGSAANILADTKMMSTIDAATIADNAAKSAWGFQVQGANDAANAAMMRAQADAIDPNKAMLTSLIGSGATVAQSWYNRRQPYGGTGYDGPAANV